MADKRQVPVRLGPAALAKFENYARDSGLKKQTILERALEQFMADNPVKVRPKKRGA